MSAREVKEIIVNLDDISEKVGGKTVLVTGGAGFLGSWLCNVLAELNANVICLDNLASGLESNISDLLNKDSFTFIKHDITRPIFFDEDMDVVLHLASRASPFEFQRFPIQILKANTLGMWIALGIAKRHKARLLYTSTSEIYGNATEIPTSEEYTGNVNPVGPRSCYDEAKRCGESFVAAYRLEHGIDARIARLFNTYGPRMRADDIYGRVVLLKLGFSEGLDGKTVNVGNDEEIAILKLAETIKKLTNSASEIKFEVLPEDDPVRRRPDIRKAKDVLNWQPTVGLEKGLERTIQWFR